MATKKAGGSTRNGRDSRPKYRGVKCFGGEAVQPGQIILTQSGTRVHAGDNAYVSRTHTIHAKTDGVVLFKHYGPKKRLTVFVVPNSVA
jgi:large subunit ribosomal protein L27